MPEPIKLLRIREVAEMLNLNRRQVYGLLKSGELPFYQFGASRRVAEEDVVAYRDANFYRASRPVKRNRRTQVDDSACPFEVGPGMLSALSRAGVGVVAPDRKRGRK